MKKTVCELFAGVGGFRVGLNDVTFKNNKTVEKQIFEFVYANQREPSTKVQHAYNCYKKRFNTSEKEFTNIDITKVSKDELPDFNLLVGGFPCQDYSVAHSLSSSKGIEGKKGVLWWQIKETIEAKKPPFILLENVDRLLKSPAKQRGRDFGIMLKCLSNLGYTVQRRVINAADYGFPQRRRRIFIFASKKTTKYSKNLLKLKPEEILFKKGIFQKTFPVEQIEAEIYSFCLPKGKSDEVLLKLSESFSYKFLNCGYLNGDNIYTANLTPLLEPATPLSSLLVKKADENLYLNDEQLSKVSYLRGSKKIKRTRADGSCYFYSEGSMSSSDSLDLPGRTMLTSEGTINRSSHFIIDPVTNKMRKLDPIECERLNMFPDNRTNCMPQKNRYFMMGNALVVGIIKKIGLEIGRIIDNE